MIMMEENSSVAKQELVILVTGLGVGCFFQPPLIALQSAMPIKDMAVSTAVFTLLRTLGGTVGISVGDTIFASELSKRLKNIPDYVGAGGSDAVTADFSALHQIEVRFPSSRSSWQFRLIFFSSFSFFIAAGAPSTGATRVHSQLGNHLDRECAPLFRWINTEFVPKLVFSL